MCGTLGHTEELPGMHELKINPFTGLSQDGNTEEQAHQHNVATWHAG